MKLLLDENLPKKLKYRFSDVYEVFTVPDLGWNGMKNGDLLKQMQLKGFTILISIDKNMSFQQNLEKHNISLLIIQAKDTRYTSLAAFVPKIEKRLRKNLQPGLVIID